MNPQEKLELAANILRRGKALVPDRFPKPDRETAQVWADALGKLFDTFPLGIWPEAVNLWAMELVGEKMISPKDLKQAAYSVRDRWEHDGQKKELLREVRRQREEERDRQIAAGTFGQLRGYKPPQALAPRRPGPGVEDMIRNIGQIPSN